MIYIWKYIKIIYFLFFKNLFLISAHQNNSKHKKNLKLKKIKIMIEPQYLTCY